MLLHRLSAGAVLLGLASLVSAAGFSGSGLSAGAVPAGQRPLGACGTTTLTHSTSQTITALNSVSCNAGGSHTDNSYFRAFSLGSFPNGFDVCALQFGVEQAVGAGGSQPVTVNIYANTGVAFPGGTRVLVGTANASVTDQSLTVLEVPVIAAVPAGAELVAEVFTPNGQTSGHSFFIGSNAGGESGPSYLAAADCGVTAPTAVSAIGFPNMHIVMNVLGTPTGGTGNLTISPAALDFGTVLVGSTSAAQAVTLTNDGTGALDVTALTAATSPFARSGGTCSATVPFTLAAGASCTLLYTFAPTGEAAANQVLTVTTNVPSSGTITLTGGALAPSVPVPTLSGLGLGLAMLLVVLTAFWTRRRA